MEWIDGTRSARNREPVGVTCERVRACLTAEAATVGVWRRGSDEQEQMETTTGAVAAAGGGLRKRKRVQGLASNERRSRSR